MFSKLVISVFTSKFSLLVSNVSFRCCSSSEVLGTVNIPTHNVPPISTDSTTTAITKSSNELVPSFSKLDLAIIGFWIHHGIFGVVRCSFSCY